MATQFDSSTEFAALVARLQNNPDDPALKQAVVKHMPEMRALAKTSPIALYQLAKVYAPNSSQYKQMMLQSASAGCTNAMLALCRLLLKTGSADDVITATHYMRMIQTSGDSFILKRSKELLEDYPGFARQLQATGTSRLYHPALNFFPQDAKNQTVVGEEQSHISAP